MERHILEGMDACRSGSDDLQLPELAPLADHLQKDETAQRALRRVQQLDAAIRAAMHDVPVPTGLADRLLAKVQQAAADQAAIATEAKVSLAPAAVADVEQRPARVSRRRWLQLTAVAASALIAVGVWSFYPGEPEHPLSVANVAERAGEWRQKVETASWTAMEISVPKSPYFPFDSRVQALPQGWMDATEAVGYEAVAYDLTEPDGPRSLLFVIDAQVAGLDVKPPHHPMSGTMGQTIATWQKGDLVYVLVTDDEQWYHDHVDTAEPLVG